MAKLVLALVLCDVPAHALKAGSLLEAADPSLVKALTSDGSVDPHKDAIASAIERGAPRARSCIELAAEQRAAQADALRVEIAGLEDLRDKATDEATKAALVTKLAELQLQLADLV